MLQAILNGKARRVSLQNEEAQSWRSVFQQYEDLLTAAFWGRISYLSDDALGNFLTSLLDIPPEEWGEFESITFWPKYLFPETIDESVSQWVAAQDSFAEPDVVLSFANAALIVEVKPPDGGQQYQQQWCKEIYAWNNSDERKNRLHFLALGNVPKEAALHFGELESLFEDLTLTCHGLEWSAVREQLRHPATEWQTRQDQRIIDDCLQALSLYGVRDRLRPWQPFLSFLAKQALPNDLSFLQGKP